MQPKQEHKALIIKVSDLTHYMLCPRLVYFRARGYEQPKIAEGKERSVIEHILLKELGFNVRKVYGGNAEGGEGYKQDEEDVKQVIEDIVDGVEWIYKEELKTVGKAFFEDVKSDFLSGIGNTEWLEKLKNENTTLAELERAYGYEREHTMRSEKLSMVGSVDKLIRTEEEAIPCVIKTGRCPEYGVWKSDRMQLAAYAMLIEEEFGTTVQRGFVDYIRTADIRESHIKKRDRALAFQILKHVKKIKKGAYPDKGENAPCDSCAFIDRCETKKTLLSKLLGK
ncbi:MAG: Dna2/Cas4 domain-containing protein [Methanosarcinales archaeon]|nr:Dna2/Cas4 domain-containing protein [Methanosarcinales archaeon]